MLPCTGAAGHRHRLLRAGEHTAPRTGRNSFVEDPECFERGLLIMIKRCLTDCLKIQSKYHFKIELCKVLAEGLVKSLHITIPTLLYSQH